MVEKEIVPREYSAGFAGGVFGDEGKGRLVDEQTDRYGKEKEVVVYRPNGGANAGHTIELPDGRRVALHQVPSGFRTEKATLVLGKGMAIHPGDLVKELEQLAAISGGKIPAEVWIDEKAVLLSDADRAWEKTLKIYGGVAEGATGRGIGPAYADYYLRNGLQMRDLVEFDEAKLAKQYIYYRSIIYGLTRMELAEMEVPSLAGNICVGSLKEFLLRLGKESEILAPYSRNVVELIRRKWADRKIAFVFEQAQAVGLDPWYGVYPDVTASRTGFDVIFDSTEGIVDPREIEYRAGVIKATYMSTVGTRRLPTAMEEGLAGRLRNDFSEYGATTGRKRGIAYLDLEALRFFARAGKFNCLVLTHMDSVYPDVPVKVCVGYKDGISRKTVHYSPDQVSLDMVTPVYKEFNPWDKEATQGARNYDELPEEAKTYLKFISEQLQLPVWMITTGPRREQGIVFENI